MIITFSRILLLKTLLFVAFGSGYIGTSYFQATETPSATSVIQTPTPPFVQPTPTPEIVTHDELVAHFEKVTEFTLKIISTAVTLLGVAGIVGGLFGFKTILDAKKSVENAERFQQKITQNLEKLEKQFEQSITYSQRLHYTLEARDSSEVVRLRAIQKLSGVDDPATVSILIERIREDPSDDVRAESAYGLGEQLKKGGQDNNYYLGIGILEAATKDKVLSVRLEALRAFHILIHNKLTIPRVTRQRLEEISEDKTENEKIVALAKEILDYMKQHGM